MGHWLFCFPGRVALRYGLLVLASYTEVPIVSEPDEAMRIPGALPNKLSRRPVHDKERVFRREAIDRL